jgi:hypothetical protein
MIVNHVAGAAVAKAAASAVAWAERAERKLARHRAKRSWPRLRG